MPLGAKTVTLHDMCMRDGMHARRHQFSLDEMTSISRGLDAAGVPLIEVTHGDGLGGASVNYGFPKHSDEEYLRAGKLHVTLLPRGTAWLDTGTFDTMVQASEFIRVIEERQGLKVGCLEEIAWRNGWIGDDDLRDLGDALAKSGYGGYLHALLDAEGPRGRG